MHPSHMTWSLENPVSLRITLVSIGLFIPSPFLGNPFHTPSQCPSSHFFEWVLKMFSMLCLAQLTVNELNAQTLISSCHYPKSFPCHFHKCCPIPVLRATRLNLFQTLGPSRHVFNDFRSTERNKGKWSSKISSPKRMSKPTRITPYYPLGKRTEIFEGRPKNVLADALLS
jgi:hypothetical protein